MPLTETPFPPALSRQNVDLVSQRECLLWGDKLEAGLESQFIDVTPVNICLYSFIPPDHSSPEGAAIGSPGETGFPNRGPPSAFQVNGCIFICRLQPDPFSRAEW